jgi:hypothetical protein
MTPSSKIWNAGGMLVMVVILALAAFSLYLHPVKQRDFLCIYTAATARNEGQDPYSTSTLPPVMGEDIAPYVYPPYTLYLFHPLTWFGLATAGRIYLTLKLIAVGGLVLLWHRLFNLNQYYGIFWILVPLAFSGTLLADVRAGNISTFEQLFIWAGFYFYARGRLFNFGLAILLAALFKMVPILLLGLLATKGKRKELAYGVFFGGILTALVTMSKFVWPELFMNFLRNVHQLAGERGELDPSSWALISDVARWVNVRCHLPAMVPWCVYAILAAVALGVSVVMFHRLKALDNRAGDLWRICLVCFLYAVMVPRLKDYSYILLIGPSFYVLSGCKWMNPLVPLGALLMIFSRQNLQFLGTMLEPFFQVEREYYCLILAWVFWALCCGCIWRETRLENVRVR